MDTTPPGPPTITNSPGPIGANAAPTWAFTGDTGATFDCKLERTTAIVADWATCASPRTYKLQSGGDYIFLVTQTDQAGNTSAAASSSYTLQTPPPPPRIDSSPGATGTDRHPTWGFSDAPGDHFECRLTRGSSTVDGRAPCTSAKTYELTSEPDGVYTFTVWAVNSVGLSSRPTTSTYDLSRPVISSGGQSPASSPSPSSGGQTPPPSTQGSSSGTRPPVVRTRRPSRSHTKRRAVARAHHHLRRPRHKHARHHSVALVPKPVKQPPAVKPQQRAGRSRPSSFLDALNAAFKAAIPECRQDRVFRSPCC